jgi:glycosyltransferase involved in cell wall biosynthesis
MYRGKTVSLVFPAYNEAENISAAIVAFQKVGVVDEIVVVKRCHSSSSKKTRCQGYY